MARRRLRRRAPRGRQQSRSFRVSRASARGDTPSVSRARHASLAALSFHRALCLGAGAYSRCSPSDAQTANAHEQSRTRAATALSHRASHRAGFSTLRGVPSSTTPREVRLHQTPERAPAQVQKDGSPCLTVDGYDDGNPCTGPYGTCVDGTCEEGEDPSRILVEASSRAVVRVMSDERVNRDDARAATTSPRQDPCVNENQPLRRPGRVRNPCFSPSPSANQAVLRERVHGCVSARRGRRLTRGEGETTRVGRADESRFPPSRPADNGTTRRVNANGVDAATNAPISREEDCCSGLSCLDIDGSRIPAGVRRRTPLLPGFICQNGMCVQESCDDGACTGAAGAATELRCANVCLGKFAEGPSRLVSASLVSSPRHSVFFLVFDSIRADERGRAASQSPPSFPVASSDAITNLPRPFPVMTRSLERWVACCACARDQSPT